LLKDISVEYKPIVFFLNNDEIIYIGKTEKKVLEYVFNRSKQINCTHYFTELVNIDEIDNILAELVLTIKPAYNPYVPKNTQFITHTKAKEAYHIEKKEFQKYWKDNGKLMFRKTLFLEKKVFDDIFSISQPYSSNMPKVGTYINCIEDIHNTPIDIDELGQSYSRREMDDGKIIEEITTFRRDIPIKENYENLQLRLKYAYQVTSILNHNTFEAYSKYKKKYIKFTMDKVNWQELLSKYEQEMINHCFLESIKK